MRQGRGPRQGADTAAIYVISPVPFLYSNRPALRRAPGRRRGGGHAARPAGCLPDGGAFLEFLLKKILLKFRVQYQSALQLHRGGLRGTSPGGPVGGAQAEATPRRRSNPGRRSDRPLMIF